MNYKKWWWKSPTLLSHLPLDKLEEKNGKTGPKGSSRRDEAWVELRKKGSTISPEVMDLLSTPWWWLSLMSLATFSTTNQPNVVSQMTGSFWWWRMWAENSLGWIKMFVLGLRQSPLLFWQQGSWMSSIHLSWDKINCSQVIHFTLSILKEHRWKTLKLVASCSLEDCYRWPSSQRCCGFCTAETNEEFRESDTQSYQTIAKWWAQQCVCRQSECGPLCFTWAQRMSRPPRPALGERHILLLPSLLFFPHILCSYQVIIRFLFKSTLEYLLCHKTLKKQWSKEIHILDSC